MLPLIKRFQCISIDNIKNVNGKQLEKFGIEDLTFITKHFNGFFRFDNFFKDLIINEEKIIEEYRLFKLIINGDWKHTP